MQYEIYIDSLFFTWLISNFYILFLVNKCTGSTATLPRVLLGALLGSVGSIWILFLAIPPWGKVIMMFFTEGVGSFLLTFRVRGFRNWMNLLEKATLLSVGTGGLLLGLTRILRLRLGMAVGVCGVIGLGGALCLWLKRLVERTGCEECYRRATLVRGSKQVTVAAILDTGNSLIEPISGKPVSIVDREVLGCLWEDAEQEIYRAVPYHSIGMPQGILRGYLLPELRVEHNGMRKVYRDIYIAVSPEKIQAGENAGTESVKMIIHPNT